MMRFLFFILLCMVLTTGCTPQMDDLVTYTQQVRARPQSPVEPYPEFKPQPVFIYSADALRSPFENAKKVTAPTEVQAQRNCLQPDFSRAKQPLEKYGIDALSLSGNFVANGVRWVLFKTNDGGVYKATQGSRLGLFFGKIIAISNSSVTVEELLPDGAGCWQRQEIVLSIGARVGENTNV